MIIMMANYSSPTQPPARPPASFRQADAAQIRLSSETLEATGHAEASHLQVQMAALLVMGDTVAARHLWRRHVDQTYIREQLQPFWKVGAAMHSLNGPSFWEALQVLESTPSTVVPLRQYALDIAESFRLRTLRPFVQKKSLLPTSLTSLLGFSTTEEVKDFCVLHAANLSHKTSTGVSLGQQVSVAAFLQSPMAL
jgi:hypothetical protein